MSLIKCAECGEKISSNATKCIHCNAPIDTNKRTKGYITDYETESNINSLNRLAAVLSVILILGGFIFLFVAIGSEEPLLIAFAIACVVMGFVMPTFIKWKALMLKNVYEINRKR